MLPPQKQIRCLGQLRAWAPPHTTLQMPQWGHPKKESLGHFSRVSAQGGMVKRKPHPKQQWERYVHVCMLGSVVQHLLSMQKVRDSIPGSITTKKHLGCHELLWGASLCAWWTNSQIQNVRHSLHLYTAFPSSWVGAPRWSPIQTIDQATCRLHKAES